jgi:hypothetical protein
MNAISLPATGTVARAEKDAGALQNDSLRLLITPASAGGHAARLFARQGQRVGSRRQQRAAGRRHRER